MGNRSLATTAPRDASVSAALEHRSRTDARDQDTAQFLLDSQRAFYEETVQFLRDWASKGVITASNWATADPAVLGPLEKLSYTVGDFIDRHGYLNCTAQGPECGMVDPRRAHLCRSQPLRFDAETPGKPNNS